MTVAPQARPPGVVGHGAARPGGVGQRGGAGIWWDGCRRLIGAGTRWVWV